MRFVFRVFVCCVWGYRLDKPVWLYVSGLDCQLRVYGFRDNALLLADTRVTACVFFVLKYSVADFSSGFSMPVRTFAQTATGPRTQYVWFMRTSSALFQHCSLNITLPGDESMVCSSPCIIANYDETVCALRSQIGSEIMKFLNMCN